MTLYWDGRGHIYDAAAPAVWDEPAGKPVAPITSFSIRQSFPALANLSVNSDPGTVNFAVRPAERPPLDSPNAGDMTGTINGWVDWDRRTIKDTPSRYEMTLRLRADAPADSATADVTPRRLQRFVRKVAHYRVKDAVSGKILAQGETNTALTVSGLPITKRGVRLELW